MKLTKYLAAATIALTAVTGAFADDFDDFGFGDSSGGFDDFSFGESSGGGSSLPFELSADLKTDVRAYVSNKAAEGIGDTPLMANPEAKIGLAYDASKVGANLQLKLNEDTLKKHQIDIIDSLTLSGYFGNFTLSAGKMKVVWGKGDKLHVLDNFNADDYTDFIIPEYIDRRISTPMIRGVYAVPYTGKTVSNIILEGIYTPFTPTNRYAESGVWKPTKVSKLENTIKNGAMRIAGNSPSAKTIMLMSSLNDNLYPDTNKFAYSQGGARVTATIGQFDLGLSYYNGRYKDVSVDQTAVSSYLQNYLAGNSPAKFMDYDRKQTFGFEFSTILWKFNLRGEAAYNLTSDIAGDDPAVHNNSVQWLGGFDIDLPFWDANLNVQEYGTYVLKNNKIDDMGIYKAYDVDYDVTGYSNNKLVVNFTTSFKNGKIAPEITTMYGFEHKDLVVMPKITFKPASSFKIISSGMYMWTNDESESEFGEWHKNSFVQLGAQVSF